MLDGKPTTFLEKITGSKGSDRKTRAKNRT